MNIFREKTTTYLRHMHLVVHSERQRFRFPVYVIQSEQSPRASSPSFLKTSHEAKRNVFRTYLEKKCFKLHCCIPLLFLILCLISGIALLSSLLTNHTNIGQCPIYDCSSINQTVDSTISNMITSSNFNTIGDATLVTNGNNSVTPLITLTSTTIFDRNLIYGEKCVEHEQCMISKGLFCQYEFDLNQKHCFCETAYFWNKNTQQCEAKKNIDEVCEYDNECRLDLGITCDFKIGTNIRHCLCMGEYYWSKISNCGSLKIQDFVHCTDELYISSCLIKEIDTGTYHNVNIRQIQNDEIEFDYFVLDSPEIQDIERIECSWSINKRYCFGIDSEENRLIIVIIGINGIESYHHINQSVIGLPNVLNQADDTIVCYIEGNDSTLLSITIDPTNNNNLLTVHQRGGKIYGERSCFLAINSTTYCFFRDMDHHLTMVAMHGTATLQDMIMNIHSETNLKTGPSCGWVGANSLLKLYCFAVFNDEKIHRIEQKDNVWNNWMIMPSDKIFIQRPLFVTSKSPDDISIAQSCHVLAIDTSNEIYVSSNMNCAHEESFSSWALLQTDIGLLSFNGSFRLRDGRVGVYGIGIDDLPYYTTMNPITHNFEPVKLAASFQ